MHDCFQARVCVHLAITLTATLALMLCYLDVVGSMSLSFNPTYRIERWLLFWASVASSRKCRDRLRTRKKFRVNRPDFQQHRTRTGSIDRVGHFLPLVPLSLPASLHRKPSPQRRHSPKSRSSHFVAVHFRRICHDIWRKFQRQHLIRESSVQWYTVDRFFLTVTANL